MKGLKDLLARQGGMWALLFMMILISALLCGLWGRQGWPIGSFWWDELALAGGAHAIELGLKPTVDFWAPFIWPFYQKWLATKLAGLSGSYVVECVLQGWIVFALFVTALWPRRLHWIGYVAVGVLIVSAVAPFNMLSVTEARLGEVSFDCSYNRLGGAIIGLIVVWVSTLQEDEIVSLRNILWLAIVLTLSFLLKITVFQLVWVLVFAKCVLAWSKDWFLLWVQSSLVAGAFVWMIFFFLGGLHGYLDALMHLSRVRSIGLDIRSMLEVLIFIHRFELALYLLPALLVVLWGGMGRNKIIGQVSWYMASLIGFCLYTITNYGDSGLMPAVSSIYALIVCSVIGRRSETPRGEVRRVEETLKKLAFMCFFLLLLLYAALVFRWVGAYYERSRRVQMEPIEFKSELLNGQYSSRVDMMGAVNLRLLDIPINVVDPQLYVQYLKELDVANQFLQQHWPSKKTRVYALDFPAYAFSVVGGYDVPKGTYPWMLFDHELNLDHYPDAASVLGGVDVLLTTRCSLSGGNRWWLFSMYRVYIEAHFDFHGSTGCWDIYSRRR